MVNLHKVSINKQLSNLAHGHRKTTLSISAREQVLTGVPVTVFEGLGHLQLCFNRDVIAWVIEQLESVSPSTDHTGSQAVFQSVVS
jgi:hypothetical protein